MSQKILVTYASRAGSTAEVALRIGAVLREQNMDVDVLPVKQVKSLQNYNAVIAGSAVRMGSWLPEAVDFVKHNQQSLNERPCAFFSVYLMNMGNDEASRQIHETYLSAARALVKPHKEAYFSGVGNPKKLGLFERMIGKMVKSPEGDFRNWESIKSWAAEVGSDFSAKTQV